MVTKFSICIWSEHNAKEMSEYYRTVFSDFHLVSENPMAVVFEVAGNRIMCLNNGNGNERFNEKISFVLSNMVFLGRLYQLF